MAWQQLTIATREEDAAVFEQLLEQLGALSITFTDGADQPIYEPPLETTPLWNLTCITGLFEETIDLSNATHFIETQITDSAPWKISLKRLEDQVWERIWLANFKPIQFANNFWICSTEHQLPDHVDLSQVTVLKLDPGLAFGTGTHPTTALCLEWLSAQSLSNKNIIDFGCGSGILAIAALLVGAKNATCIDIDPQALTATLDNADKNNVGGQVQIFNADNYPSHPSELVLANILAEPLMSLSQEISRLVKSEGTLILSGILGEQVDQVKAYYEDSFVFETTRIKDNWACLIAIKKP